MLPNNLLKINSLEDKLIDLFYKYYINNPHNKKDDIKRKEDLYFSLIPIDLIFDVKKNIAKNYGNDCIKYFEDVSLYFNIFKLLDLQYTKEDLYKEHDYFETVILEKQTENLAKRFLKKKRKEKLFHASVLLKLVGAKADKYCARSILNEYMIDKKKEKSFIENCKIIGKNRKIYNLKDCIKSNNQKIAEILNIIDTQEQIALEKKWTWCFITLTLMGEYHPNPKFGKNNYNGMSPKDSAIMMNNNIKRVRALLQKWGIKAGIHMHGSAGAECHLDACIHKHLIVFCANENIEIIRKAFEYHFPNIDDESFKVESEENKLKPWKKTEDEYIKGKFREKASSYVFKYIMKSIEITDSDKEFDELTEEEQNTLLNASFRSSNSIRGFSFFGIENCLTKFRFIARNYKDMELPSEIVELIKKNDLYSLLTKGYLKMFENVYVEEKSKQSNKTFIGCKFLEKMFFKRFFKLIKNAGEKLTRKEIAINYISMKHRERDLLSLLVIVNHNYSRRAKEFEKPTAKERKDWLEWVKNNPAI